MKKAAVFVTLAYAVLFTLFLQPLVYLSFYDDMASTSYPNYFAFLLNLFKSWPYWVFIGVLVLCQAGLLTIPVRSESKRPVSKRSVVWPAITSGFLVGLLAFGFAMTAYEMVSNKIFELPSFTLDVRNPHFCFWAFLFCCALLWLCWSIIFYRLSKDSEPQNAITRLCKYLFRGSFLELLVAVPCHIIARQRPYCCAGLFTFFGLAFGLAVMLVSFGPGLYFLYADRLNRLRRR